MKLKKAKNCVPSKVKKYKAMHPPRCHGGKGCTACWDKWLLKNTRYGWNQSY